MTESQVDDQGQVSENPESGDGREDLRKLVEERRAELERVRSERVQVQSEAKVDYETAQLQSELEALDREIATEKAMSDRQYDAVERMKQAVSDEQSGGEVKEESQSEGNAQQASGAGDTSKNDQNQAAPKGEPNKPAGVNPVTRQESAPQRARNEGSAE